MTNETNKEIHNGLCSQKQTNKKKNKTKEPSYQGQDFQH